MLVVDDSHLDAAIICELLRDMFEPEATRVVRTLEAALDALPGSYELILLDLGLPDAQGLEVVRRVRAASQNIPIVVLTGLDDASLAKQCLEHGAQDYVVKHELDRRTLERAIEYARARDRAQRLTRRLEHADRLAAVGQLAATVAHEINNPAAFVRLNTEQLHGRVEELLGRLEDGEGPEASDLRSWLVATREILVENLEGIDRVARLVKDLRLFSKPDNDELEVVDVPELCRSSLNVVLHHIRHHARVMTRLEEVPTVVADPRRLGQVLINLLMNAAQAFDHPSSSNEVELSTRLEGSSVIIVVRDNGRGIPADSLSKIFTPFFTTKPGAEGTGLGLTISRDIVENLGGKIHVESGVRGTVFEVRLPAFADGQVAREPLRASPAPSRTEAAPRRRVLVVDDEVSVLRAVERGLSRTHEVTTASSGEEALAVLDGGERFDVILCDLMMAGMGGEGFVRTLETRDPELYRRTIVVSGGAATPEAMHFIKTTPLRVLLKPVSLSGLRDAIEQAAQDGGAPPER